MIPYQYDFFHDSDRSYREKSHERHGRVPVSIVILGSCSVSSASVLGSELSGLSLHRGYLKGAFSNRRLQPQALGVTEDIVLRVAIQQHYVI